MLTRNSKTSERVFCSFSFHFFYIFFFLFLFTDLQHREPIYLVVVTVVVCSHVNCILHACKYVLAACSCAFCFCFCCACCFSFSCMSLHQQLNELLRVMDFRRWTECNWIESRTKWITREHIRLWFVREIYARTSLMSGIQFVFFLCFVFINRE